MIRPPSAALDSSQKSFKQINTNRSSISKFILVSTIVDTGKNSAQVKTNSSVRVSRDTDLFLKKNKT